MRLLTLVELLHDAVRVLSLLTALLALSALLLAPQGLALVVTLLAQADGADGNGGGPPSAAAPIALTVLALLTTTLLLLPASIHALHAVHTESVPTLLRHKKLATAAAAVAFVVGLCNMSIAPAYVASQVGVHCRSIMQAVPESWLAHLPPTQLPGCPK